MHDFSIFTQHLPADAHVARITLSDIGAVHEVEPGFLKGVLYIFGVLFHAQFIRVKYCNEIAFEVTGTVLTPDVGATNVYNEDGDGVQGPWNDDPASLCNTWWHQSMIHVDECAFATIEVPGFEGQYVLLIHPGERW